MATLAVGSTASYTNQSVCLNVQEGLKTGPKEIIVSLREITDSKSIQESLVSSSTDTLSFAVKKRSPQDSKTKEKALRSNIFEKAKEGVRLSRTRIHSALSNPDRPVSQIGRFHKHYVEYYNYTKNERIISSPISTKIQIKNGLGKTQDVLHGASHNYLGLYEGTPESELLHRQCLDKLPVSNSCTNSNLEAALNDAVCELYNTDFCCTTGTGYASNVLVFPAIVDESWLLVMDEKSHNSMFVAAYASNVGSIRKFRHNNMQHLEEVILESAGKFSHVLVAIEGLYSMEATIPQLDALAALKKKYAFTILADEAHSFLALGRTGKGCIECWNDEYPKNQVPTDLIDIRTATLSKSPGAVGGLVFGTERFQKAILERRKELLVNGLDPISNAAIVQTLFVLGQPALRKARSRKLLQMIRHVRTELTSSGMFVYGSSASPVLPIHTGAPTLAGKSFEVLRDCGVLSSPVVTPAVGFWEGRIRLTLNAGTDVETTNRLVNSVIAAAQIVKLTKKSCERAQPFHYDTEDDADHREIELRAITEKIQNLIILDATVQDSAPQLASSVREVGHNSRLSYGLACGGSRWIGGTTVSHKNLEATIADVVGTESVMTYPDFYIGLTSTVAALSRPATGYKKHRLLFLASSHQAIQDGLKMANKTSRPVVNSCADISDLLRKARALAKEKTQITIYMTSSSFLSQAIASSVQGSLNDLGRRTSITLLLHDSAGFGGEVSGFTREMPNVHVLVYGSFYQAFELPGSYLAGSNVLVKELRYSSRGYMFTSSHMPFIVAMIEARVKEMAPAGR